MAKIAIDAREIGTSTGRYVERLIHYLQKIDKDNQYLVLLKPTDYKTWQPIAKNFTKVLCTAKEFSLDEQTKLNKQLKELKPDLVHFAMVQQPVMYKGRTITTMHDLTTTRFVNPAKNRLIFKFKQQIYKKVNWFVPKKSKYIITPSEFIKEDIINFANVKPNKIIVTYEAADEIITPAEPINELRGKPFIFYVGRPQPHKNLKRLIEAFALLKNNNPDLLLVLGGRKDSVYESYLNVAKECGVEKSVIFTGYVSEGQLKWLYRTCKAYVFPSLSEGFGLPGLEAMLNRAPVVSSNATCLPEIYGSAAWYCDPYIVEDIANSIDEVLTNSVLRNRLIRSGREQAKKYSWQKMAEQTLEIYKKALSK